MQAMDDNPPKGIRARARAELLADVGRIARSHLAESGAAALSVRAIARELGLASSALYRYYPSRDALLTQLIIDSYNSLGTAAEQAEAAVDPIDVAGRYSAICHSVRTWALANPHEYALIYGSPVPGYAAPDDTIDPAIRVALTLGRIAADVKPSARLLRADTPISGPLIDQLASVMLRDAETDPEVLVLGVGLWAQLFGLVSFELFGTFNNTFEPADALFNHQIALGIRSLGLQA